MSDIFRKTLYAGLGATVVTAERLAKGLDDLVQRGRISATEAEDVANKIMNEGRKEFEEGSGRISAMMDEMMRKANFARQRDFEDLEKRVSELERQQRGTSPGVRASTVPPPQPDAMPPPPPPAPGDATMAHPTENPPVGKVPPPAPKPPTV